MDREIRWAALIALASVVALVLCLTAAELLDIRWLYVPGIALMFVALGAGEIAVWGLRAFTIITAGLFALLVVAFVAERVG